MVVALGLILAACGASESESADPESNAAVQTVTYTVKFYNETIYRGGCKGGDTIFEGVKVTLAGLNSEVPPRGKFLDAAELGPGSKGDEQNFICVFSARLEAPANYERYRFSLPGTITDETLWTWDELAEADWAPTLQVA